jgi:hypothetical protein
MTVDGGMNMSADFVEKNTRGIIFLTLLALTALVATAPAVLSDEIPADGKGDLLPITSDVGTVSNQDCKSDLGIDTKDGCQIQL